MFLNREDIWSMPPEEVLDLAGSLSEQLGVPNVKLHDRIPSWDEMLGISHYGGD